MKKYIAIFLVSFIIFMGILGGSYVYLNNAEAIMHDPDFKEALENYGHLTPPEAEKEAIVNTLLLGVDDARSDTMIVVRYNRKTNQIAMISIPRDTRVDIPGYGYSKINSAIGKKEGTALAMKTVGNLLDIPIHHYVKVDFEGVKKIIDIMGGVKMNIPKLMKYSDPTQDLEIYIEPGEQVLNGEKSLQFLRYRSGYVDQDLGRIKAQQEFAKAFIDKLTSPAMILKASSIVNAMVENTKTNLEQGEITQYILDIPQIKMDNISMYTLPGEPGNIKGAAYFIHNQEKMNDLMTEISDKLGETVQSNSQDKATNLSEDNTTLNEKEQLSIEILNSTKTKGLASTLKKELEKKGYQVARIGDTNDLTYSYSRVIDRRGDLDKLELISEETGITIVDSDIDREYAYDITIIIGNDRK